MRNIFNIDNDEKTRILSLHENSTKKQYLNLIVEQEQTTSGGTTNDTWLKFPDDKMYEYLKKDNKWFARKIGTTKEFDLSSNPKYKKSVDKLNKQFPDGKSSVGAEVKTNTPATNVTVKNETLPGAPVYYPWIQDGKLNTEKLKQSIEDNSINKWLDELKKLTPELLTKVRQDLASSGIPTNLTTTKGTGLYYNLNDLLKTAEKMVANAQPQGGSQPQGGDGSPAIVGGEQTSLESL